MDIACVNERMTALAASLLLSLFLSGCLTSSPDPSLMNARDRAPAPTKTNPYPDLEDSPSIRAAGRRFHQFDMRKHSEPSNKAASISAAQTTEIESQRLSLSWTMSPLPSR
jgi:hypothetical protein